MSDSILARVLEMFSAKECHHGEDDVLRNALFEYTSAFINSEQFKCMQLPKDLVDFADAYTEYITRDRPLQVNELIEAELNYENSDPYIVEEQDFKCLCEIIRHRKIIFSNFNV